jgi:excisionase family DNA binding protein
MTEEASEWLSPRQAAQHLGVSPATIRRLADAGALAAYRLGKLRRYRRADLDACLTPITPEGGSERSLGGSA